MVNEKLDDELVNSKNVENNSTDILESKSDLINALQQEFATNVNRIYINSIKKDVDFREITVQEQKTLSRIMIDNDGKGRKDVVFDAQCALINKVCLDKTFDIYRLTEFDRLKLLIAIYQANMYKNEIKFKCPECGTENSYKLDFNNVLIRLDDINVEDQTFEYENKNWKYQFVIGYPDVSYVAKFHKGNIRRYRGIGKSQIQSVDQQVSFDYVDLYIKKIVIVNKLKDTKRIVRVSDYQPHEVEEIISIFPQDVLYSETGVLRFITNNFIKVINDCFDKQYCYQCGEEYKNTVQSPSSFL